MNKRNVPFTTLLKLLPQNVFAFLGVFFTFGSLVFMLPFLYFMSADFTKPYEKYDFAKIEQKGVERDATVLGKDIVYNITVNGYHPVIITYQYAMGGKIKTDKFQAMESYQLDPIKAGSPIRIKSLGNQSKIQGLAPYSFPVYFFYIVPLSFIFIGIIFLVIGLKPLLKRYNLYKNGIVKDGFVTAVEQENIFFRKKAGKRMMVIDYYHIGSKGEKIYDVYKTTDDAIVAECRAEERIKIFVSEEDESKSCIVPRNEARKNNWKI